MRWIEFNVNRSVLVQLTEEGRDLLRARHRAFNLLVQEKGGKGFTPLEIIIALSEPGTSIVSFSTIAR